MTSLPDVSELKLSMADWQRWFVEAAAQLIDATPDDGLTIFFQSDIKRDGHWVDKGFLVQRAAGLRGAHFVFHKIVCRAAPGAVTYGRAGYSHLIGLSRGVRLELSRATPDVLPDAGATTWTRGMGTLACRAACQLVRSLTGSKTIVDPFCGHGTVLAVANAMGFDAIGVELSEKRARKARTLTLETLEAASG